MIYAGIHGVVYTTYIIHVYIMDLGRAVILHMYFQLFRLAVTLLLGLLNFRTIVSVV